MSEIRADKLHNVTGDNDSGIDLSTNDQVDIKIADSVKARVDSSGNVLFSTTGTPDSVVGSSGAGMAYEANGFLGIARAGSTLILNRRSDDGDIISLKRDGAQKAQIASSNGGNIVGLQSGGSGLGVHVSANIIYPVKNNSTVDDNIDLGSSGVRFDDVFATNTSIQTSDRNEKQDIEELTDAEQRVAVAAKGLLRKYRWRDAVATKGDNARTHFGIIAQDLQDAFTAEGLDASKYAMFCSDTWFEKQISVDAVEADEENGIQAQDGYTYTHHYLEGEEVPSDATEKTRLGVRYSELLAFIISAM